jgi:predicted DNA-binding transcriptional regulator YafY
VRVWFHAHAQERAQRESYATLIEEHRRDGGAEFTLYSYSLEWTAQWLLSFGERAEAVAPAKLRRLVRTAAEKIAAKHG